MPFELLRSLLCTIKHVIASVTKPLQLLLLRIRHLSQGVDRPQVVATGGSSNAVDQLHFSVDNNKTLPRESDIHSVSNVKSAANIDTGGDVLSFQQVTEAQEPSAPIQNESEESSFDPVKSSFSSVEPSKIPPQVLNTTFHSTLNISQEVAGISRGDVMLRSTTPSGIHSTLGIALFLLVPIAVALQRWRQSLAVQAAEARRKRIISSDELQAAVGRMEELVQCDEAQRGIADIIPGPGELFAAAEECCKAQRVAILTGFPCCIDNTPPTETDGPLGALAIAKALLLLGKSAVVLTDQCNEEVLLACAAATDFSDSDRSRLSLESFPALGGGFDCTDQERLTEISAEVDLIIAVERTGLNAGGKYLTMRGRDMSQFVAPLDMLLLSDADGETPADQFGSSSAGGCGFRSIGIGDGGNELGMGKVLQKITASTRIENAELIACVVPTDHLIVSSVSNWGAYALVAATALLNALNNSRSESVSNGSPLRACDCSSAIVKLLPTDEEELLKCKRIVLNGARDGVTGKQEQSVDGMPIEASIKILQQLRKIID